MLEPAFELRQAESTVWLLTSKLHWLLRMHDYRCLEWGSWGGAGRVREGFLGEVVLNRIEWQLRRTEHLLDSVSKCGAGRDRQREPRKASCGVGVQQQRQECTGTMRSRSQLLEKDLAEGPGCHALPFHHCSSLALGAGIRGSSFLAPSWLWRLTH